MKVVELLESRRRNWQELDKLCEQLRSRKVRSDPEQLTRFASLYRAACADLALADAYQLPPDLVQYLHRLVGRAHNQLYRSRQFNFRAWSQVLLYDAPRQVFRDGCVQLAFCLFWGVFILSAILAYSKSAWPDYATQVLGEAGIAGLEENFADPLNGRGAEADITMAAFYIWNNTGIGLKCFAGGLLFIPGLFVTTYNAAYLGAAFGYMGRPEVAAGPHFFEFVRAHGPFELTAIVLSAGGGLRLGLAWLRTNGLTRAESMRRAASESMAVMGAAIVLFFLAALIEGFLSPSPAPKWIKTAVAVASSLLLTFYFVVLGMQGDQDAA